MKDPTFPAIFTYIVQEYVRFPFKGNQIDCLLLQSAAVNFIA